MRCRIHHFRIMRRIEFLNGAALWARDFGGQKGVGRQRLASTREVSRVQFRVAATCWRGSFSGTAPCSEGAVLASPRPFSR